MKRRIIAMLLMAVMTLSLTACGGSDNGAGSTDGLEEISVVLDWYPNAVHGFMYVAMEKGYYEEEGLKLNIQFPSNTNDAISLTAAGKADLGVYYQQDVIMARANQNIPVKTVGTILQSPMNIILSLKEKNITTAKDLEGKKIGYAGTELSESIIKVMAESAGIDFSTIELVDVGFDLMSSMTTGNVDATIGCMANHEVPAMENEGFDVNYFFPNEYGVPDYYELVFVTSEDNVKNNSDKIARFLRASKKGFDDVKANPQEALQILLDNQNTENFPLIEEVERKSYEMLLPAMETDNAAFLSQDTAVWENNIKWLLDEGLITTEVKASDIVANIEY